MLLSSGTAFAGIIFGGPPSLIQRIRGAYLISRSRTSLRRSSARDAGPPPQLSRLKAGEPRICQSRPPLEAPVPPRAHPKGVAKKGVHLATTRVIGSAKVVASLISRGMAHVCGVGGLSILMVIIPSRACSMAFTAPPRVPMASPLVLWVGGPPIMAISGTSWAWLEWWTRQIAGSLRLRQFCRSGRGCGGVRLSPVGTGPVAIVGLPCASSAFLLASLPFFGQGLLPLLAALLLAFACFCLSWPSWSKT